ncbi:MAG: hypothetical protein E7620_03200 [Ruminococcaceae bacterium]|nr:hypothetical protein [Oscillospiraceae bacterium]
MKKALSFILVALMLATACLLPISAENEVEIYSSVNFDDCTLGAVPSGTLLTPVFKVDDTGSTIVAREGNDKALRFDDKKDAPIKMNNGYLPFTSKINGASNFSQLPNDMVLAYDFLISEGNGEKISLFNGRSPVKKWGKALDLLPDEATGLGVISGVLISGGNVTSQPCVPYGEWVHIDLVIKHNAANTEVAKIDVYINSILVLQGFEAHGDFSNITVIKFAQDAVSPTDCYILTDNILLYAGNKIMGGDDQPDTPDTPSATEAPTDEVTDAPTAEITAAPTAEPTKAPTKEATAPQTKAPTAEGTVPGTNPPATDNNPLPEKKGCGAAVGALGIISLLAIVSCGAIALKKKEN